MAQTKMQVGFIESLTASVTELNILDGATANATELNLLDNVSGLVQADLIKLAAINSTATELNLLNSVSGLVQADLTKLAAVDSTAVELNLLNGVSGLVQADLTKLAAVDSSAAELNLLDGVSGLVQADLTKLAAIDSTAVEINLLDALDRGSILYGNPSGVTTVLGQGTTDQVLTSDGNDIAWQDAGGGVVSGGTNNAVLRADGTGGSTSQGSSVILTDGNEFQAGNGSASAPTYSFASDPDTGFFFPTCGQAAISIATGGVERARFTSRELLINDDCNGHMTQGIGINQGAFDDEILTLKSSDVCHGVTGEADTTTYAKFEKEQSGNGGLRIETFSDSGARSFYVRAIAPCQNNIRSGYANAPIMLAAGRPCPGDTTTYTNQEANKNLMVIAMGVPSGQHAKFIFDSDGDSHEDGSGWTNFDDYCDPTLVRSLEKHLTRKNDPIQANFNDFLAYNRCQLEAAKLVTFNDDGHHFINTSRLAMLHNGAIWQLSERIKAVETQLALTEGKIDGNNI